MMIQKFTCCMSVYKNDNPNHFMTAIRSIINQTVKPDEIILVVDGPIPEALESAVKTLLSELNILTVIRFDENKGHAAARQAGVDNASNELIAIMDSDDIAVENRFEIQLGDLDEHPEVSVIGGNISEFIDTVDNVVGKRMCPESNDDIIAYLKARCPMNLVTVMMKKSDINAVGGFIDWYCEEDYYLWVRLAQHGYKFYNVQENLVNVRVGNEMYQRRGGWRYFKSEAKLQKYMWQNNIIGLLRLCYNVLGRFAIQVAMPNWLRGFVFQKLFRK